jgi:hypothetical protein
MILYVSNCHNLLGFEFQLAQKGINVIRYYNKAKDLVEIQSPKDYDNY